MKFPFFSFIYQIISKKSTDNRPNAVHALPFPLEKKKAFFRKTERLNHFSLKHLKLIICWNWNFYFLDISSSDSEGSWSVLNKNTTTRKAKIPAGILGHMELPIPTLKTLQHRSIDINNTLVHSVVHIWRPGKTEPVKVHYQDEQPNVSFGRNHIDL